MSQWRAIEFFAGLGGFAAAVKGRFAVNVALDINDNAGRWYRSQFNHPYLNRSIDGLKQADICVYDANLWWLSPPCQPFTHKGKRLDWNDNRNRAFRNLLEHLPNLRPELIAMENVPGFQGSQTQAAFQRVVDQLGYQLTEFCLCPSELGIPNQRRRYYAIAASMPIQLTFDTRSHLHVGDFVNSDHDLDPELQLSPSMVQRFQKGMHICDVDSKTTRCFTAGYGKNWVKSGSYLRHSKGIRIFHPLEVASLLGHSLSEIPAGLSYRQAWKLLGNSLSLFVMRPIVNALIESKP